MGSCEVVELASRTKITHLFILEVTESSEFQSC